VGMTGQRGNVWGHKNKEGVKWKARRTSNIPLSRTALDVMSRKNGLVREAIWSCKLE
jgi:hypothetical protein